MRKTFLTMSLVMGLALAMGLAGCESEDEKRTKELAAEFRAINNNELPSNWQALARRAISEKLKDPGSAQFKFEEGLPIKSGEDWLFGVNVNAKNSFGGYTGGQVWTVAIRNRKVVALEIMSEEEAKLYREIQRR